MGEFFRQHGRSVATWQVSRANEWSLSWFKGDHERIFSSEAFLTNEVFEDDPWWLGDFYKVLFHRFPDARFVLLERDADRWFDSMVAHSGGRTLGNTHRHANLYRREEEYAALPGRPGAYTNDIDNLLPLNEEHREHYKRIYNARNREIAWFFERFGPQRLFQGRLEDPLVWKHMGDAFGIRVADGYTVHANASPRGNGNAAGTASGNAVDRTSTTPASGH